MCIRKGFRPSMSKLLHFNGRPFEGFFYVEVRSVKLAQFLCLGSAFSASSCVCFGLFLGLGQEPSKSLTLKNVAENAEEDEHEPKKGHRVEKVVEKETGNKYGKRLADGHNDVKHDGPELADRVENE